MGKDESVPYLQVGKIAIPMEEKEVIPGTFYSSQPVEPTYISSTGETEMRKFSIGFVTDAEGHPYPEIGGPFFDGFTPWTDVLHTIGYGFGITPLITGLWKGIGSAKLKAKNYVAEITHEYREARNAIRKQALKDFSNASYSHIYNELEDMKIDLYSLPINKNLKPISKDITEKLKTFKDY